MCVFSPCYEFLAKVVYFIRRQRDRDLASTNQHIGYRTLEVVSRARVFELEQERLSKWAKASADAEAAVVD